MSTKLPIVGANGTRGRKSKDSAQIHRGQVRARGTRRRQKTRKIDFRWFLVISGHRDPQNRVRHQILRILVVGELRGMSFSDLMQNCATNRLRRVLLAPTIQTLKHLRNGPMKNPDLLDLGIINKAPRGDKSDWKTGFFRFVY